MGVARSGAGSVGAVAVAVSAVAAVADRVEVLAPTAVEVHVGLPDAGVDDEKLDAGAVEREVAAACERQGPLIHPVETPHEGGLVCGLDTWPTRATSASFSTQGTLRLFARARALASDMRPNAAFAAGPGSLPTATHGGVLMGCWSPEGHPGGGGGGGE